MIQEILLKRRQVISLSKDLRNLLLQEKNNSTQQKLLIEVYKKELLWLHRIINH
jgi:hypothetical protein